jgi:hypothetical protein
VENPDVFVGEFAMTILSETIVSDELPRTLPIPATITVTCTVLAEIFNPNVNRAPIPPCGRRASRV